jgi:Uri superfamily endonuclease
MALSLPNSGLTESLPTSDLTESSPASGLADSLPASGLYVLLLRLKKSVTIRVGALGEREFPAGWYAYTGSARRGLAARVARHMASEKPLRWHIDHLTTAEGIRPLGAVLIPTTQGLTECEVNRRVGLLTGGSAPVPRFGASDCRNRCPAHLWHSARAVDAAALTAAFAGANFFKR